ncbi:hypothetical protein N7G274_005586 [Stereocaulon virgatum]|uniref:Uncharacterized protein n=1 Tax=Stereocaulon virgatum TaxID=373712 RepID=A0ABR4A7B2_9LECA
MCGLTGRRHEDELLHCIDCKAVNPIFVIDISKSPQQPRSTPQLPSTNNPPIRVQPAALPPPEWETRRNPGFSQSLQPYERPSTQDARFALYNQTTAIENERQSSIARHPPAGRRPVSLPRTRTRANITTWLRTVRSIFIEGVEYPELLEVDEAKKIDSATIHIPHRTIQSHWDFILNDIIKERSALRSLNSKNPDLEWYLARSCSRNGDLSELPESALLVQTTKELLESDFFDKTAKDKEWLVTLIVQKRLSQEKLYERSPPKKEPSIKKEPYIKEEISNDQNTSKGKSLLVQATVKRNLPPFDFARQQQRLYEPEDPLQRHESPKNSNTSGVIRGVTNSRASYY